MYTRLTGPLYGGLSKMLAVVITDTARVGEFVFERRRFGSGEAELGLLADWLSEQGVQEAVMESTAQYWKPVWQVLEGSCKLHLAQAWPQAQTKCLADRPPLWGPQRQG